MKPEAQERRTLQLNDTFQFKCGPHVPCFTRCCRDVTIFLTPYDILRMKNKLGLSSGEFLQRYTSTLKIKDKLIPLVILKMGEEPEKRCLLVREKVGCTVYEDRPWSCRMYPLDQTGPVGYRFLVDSDRCEGLRDPHAYQVSDYLVDQGILIYKEMEELFEEVTNHEGIQDLDVDSEKVEGMLYMALYDLDRFRDFVFNSRFLKTFRVDDRTIQNIRRSDVELMKFAFKWIRYGLFGDPFFELIEQPAPGASSEAEEG